jgi:hypothetical protein
MERNEEQRIEQVRQRLETWRKSRRPRARIPVGLWNVAAELARSYGIHKVARALHLDYYNLKQRRDGTVGKTRPGAAASASFVEVIPGGSSAECVIEMENRRGAKIRIHFKGGSLPDAASLGNMFWKNGR